MKYSTLLYISKNPRL